MKNGTPRNAPRAIGGLNFFGHKVLRAQWVPRREFFSSANLWGCCLGIYTSSNTGKPAFCGVSFDAVELFSGKEKEIGKKRKSQRRQSQEARAAERRRLAMLKSAQILDDLDVATAARLLRQARLSRKPIKATALVDRLMRRAGRAKTSRELCPNCGHVLRTRYR